MKRINKHHFRGIRNKLFLLIMITMLLLAAVFFGVTEYRNYRLSQLTSEASRKQQVSIALNTNAIMTEVIQNNLNRITGLEASVTDEIFQGAKSRVTLLSQFATRMFANPDSYSPKPWAPPDPAMEGQLSAQVILADNVDPSDPKLQATVGFAANLNNLMLSICRTFESDNIYVGLPEGAFLSVSENASTWYLEDGSLMSYDARTRFWYKQAAEAGCLVFSDLEVDVNTGEMSVVCAMPVYDPEGALVAVVGSDLFLHAMEKEVKGLVSDGGYSWIVNRNGHVIYSPNPELMQMNESANAIDLRTSENKELADLLKDAMSGGTDVRVVTVNGEAYYMQGIPIDTVGWTLFSAFPKKTVDQVENTLLNSYDQITDEARVSYQEDIRLRSHSTMILLGLMALAAASAALLVGKRIVKPLNTITAHIASINEQNPEFKMESSYRTGDEIEVLAESFASLSHKTVQYVEEVRQVTAEKERISTELQMAKQIQEGMLPSIFPAFPERSEFDLYASMDPAKEVGGDFYDFFLIDDDHLALIMADVSGKGVPGALFMMASKIIMNSSAMMGGSPAEILAQANKTICANNPMEMFVTVWLGILEISTGRLAAANAGHEYPIIKRSDGSFELFKDKHGLIVGGIDGATYKGYDLVLRPGDKLFLYTDGVPEATDQDMEMFGTERMLTALNKFQSEAPEEILTNMRETVDSFVGNADQFDDLTMLCLEYKGKKA